MVNPFAGEAELTLDGQRCVLKLTLGALAELESTLQAESLVALIERFESGGYSAQDVMALLLAGLRGGGWSGSATDLAKAEIAGGPIHAARVAAQLLARAFRVPDGAV